MTDAFGWLFVILIAFGVIGMPLLILLARYNDKLDKESKND